MITEQDLTKLTEIETSLGLASDDKENIFARIIRILKKMNP